MTSDDDRPFEDQAGSDGEAPPGPDELRAIVARSGRHHRRAAAVGMAATLIVGAAAGYLISGRSTASSTTVAVGSSPSTTSGAVGGSVNRAGVAGTSPFGPAGYTALFTRTAGPVTVRGFLTNFPRPSVAQAPRCRLMGPPSFRAELSTAKMVGEAEGFGIDDRTKPLSAVTAVVVGVPEGDPTAAVAAAAGPGVAKVRVAYTGGATDEMAPMRGWVALAAEVPGAAASATTPVGTLTALNAAGRVLSSQTVTMASGGMQFTGPCGSPCPLQTTTTTSPTSPTPPAAPSTTTTTANGSAGPPATAPSPPAGALSPPAGAPSAPSPVIACAESPTTVPALGGPVPFPVPPRSVVPSPPVLIPTVPGK